MKMEKMDDKENDEYFRSGPVGSRIGAWVSSQSEVVGEEEIYSW